MERVFVILSILSLSIFETSSQNHDPQNIEIITSDIYNFWIAYEKSLPNYNPEAFNELYIEKGSKGLKGFIKNRIQSGEHLSKIITKRPEYYRSLKEITPRIPLMNDSIKKYLSNLKELYPDAIFPPVYFVIGAMNSGGTTSRHGLIIGAEMFGLTEDTPTEELSQWHKKVIKPIDAVPHIVAHELVHFQQKYDGGNLLKASIKEGSADFIAELISGSHPNDHIHDFANQREEELWNEFKEKMYEKDYKGWLYSSQEGRPNDLGYWMGYKITKSYYDQANDKKEAINQIMRIKDFKQFLADSRYAEKFN